MGGEIPIQIPSDRAHEDPAATMLSIAPDLQTRHARVLPNTDNPEVHAILTGVSFGGAPVPQDMSVPALPSVPGLDVQGQCQLIKVWCQSHGLWPGRK